MRVERSGVLTTILGVLLIFAAPQSAPAQNAPQVGGEPLSCADKSIVAGAVRTQEDVRAFVQCAYEFVQEVGFEEARRAFHEDARWKSGPTYVFVDEVTPVTDEVRSFVYPPNPSVEGIPGYWGLQIDVFGNDLFLELYRVVSNFSEGWFYYSFLNPATGNDEPKAAYVKAIDWSGVPSAIGAGIYRRDLPGTCRSEEVNAMQLEATPSDQNLREFVRCAAMELESNGYFAIRALSSDPRWRSQSIYLFGLDTDGNTLFSSDPDRQGYGFIASELNNDLDGPFEGRDVVSVGAAFGETFLYYSTRDPSTGMVQRKVAFVKRIVVYGLPILVGAGIYTDCPPGRCTGANEPTDALTFTFDFNRGPQGFVAGFADYPPADAEFYELTSDYRALPPPLESHSALFISGVNRSDDLFMFFKGPIGGLLPGARYNATVSAEIATNTPAGCIGVGGGPGESVWIKAGASAIEPLPVSDGSYLRMNIDIGSQSGGGAQAVVLGNIANSRSCEQSHQWERKSFQGRPTPVPISIAPNGRAWLLFGVDSGFEDRTAIYFTRVSVTFSR